MQIDIKNLLAVNGRHGLSLKEIKKAAKKLPDYLDKIKSRNQGFYSVIDDKKMVREIEGFARQAQGKFKDVVILGIGGSALGTIGMQQSLGHLFPDELPRRKTPHLHILDNIDPDLITQVEDVIDYPSTLFIVVTKSGATPETLAQYFYFRKKCENRKLDHRKHFVFITDPEKGLLRKIANEEGVAALEVPGNIGGRFSVLTPMGLLPAKLIGVDIKRF